MLQTDLRRKALDKFADMAGLERIERLVQSGRDPESAHYTIWMQDGRTVRLGTIRALWSQTEMSKVLAVTLGKPLPPISPASWDNTRTRLLAHAVEVEERDGETFADTVRDWLGAYCEKAHSGERDGAMAAKRPFTENEDIHVHAVSFARDIRRQYSATVKERDLISALGDLGFERRTIHYSRGGKRSTASYYVAPIDVLDPGEEM